MTSGQQPDQPKRDPADFLADMAGGEPEEITPPEQTDDETDDEPDPLAALDLMAGDTAEGPAELEVFDEPDEPAEGAQSPADAFAAGMDEPTYFPAPRARAAALAGRRASHHGHLYRKVMVPSQLVVGALLVLVGIMAIIKLIASRDQCQADWYGKMIWVAVVSFPLSGAMFLGAWAFRREIRRR